MFVNRNRAEKAIQSAKRELKNALTSLEEKDYAGALKYFQECTEYAFNFSHLKVGRL